MKVWVIACLLLLPLVCAHEENSTVNGTNTTDQDNPLECNPGDELDQSAALWIVLAVIIGGVVLAFSVKHDSVLLSLLGLAIMVASLVYAWNAMELNEYTGQFDSPGSAHIHADFAVMVNNQLVDFTDDRYITYKGHERSIYVHLHDPDNVVHVHAQGVTWEYFFKTIDVHLDDACLVVRNDSICGATFLRNNTIAPNLLHEPIAEGDRVLFHYGTGNASLLFDQAVGERACLHSGTCPQRGVLKGCSSAP